MYILSRWQILIAQLSYDAETAFTNNVYAVSQLSSSSIFHKERHCYAVLPECCFSPRQK